MVNTWSCLSPSRTAIRHRPSRFSSKLFLLERNQFTYLNKMAFRPFSFMTLSTMVAVFAVVITISTIAGIIVLDQEMAKQTALCDKRPVCVGQVKTQASTMNDLLTSVNTKSDPAINNGSNPPDRNEGN